MSKKLKMFLVVSVTALASLSIAAPANAVVCHDDPGSCCGGIVILGKEYLHYDC
jgi:hypothetical protein